MVHYEEVYGEHEPDESSEDVADGEHGAYAQEEEDEVSVEEVMELRAERALREGLEEGEDEHHVQQETEEWVELEQVVNCLVGGVEQFGFDGVDVGEVGE